MTKRTRKNIPKGFDSWLEFDLSKELRQCKFHTEKIPYVQRKTYEPDFIFSGCFNIIYYMGSI